MMEYHIKESFRDWNPNIQSLADRLLIGPQRELLEKIQRLNQRFGLGLNITRTYRWSPGYMDKIKDWMMNKYVEVHMKRKISTFFNQIYQKSWAYDELRRQLNQIDDKMAEKRRLRAVFQDNSDLIEDRWVIFYRILTQKHDMIRESLPNIDLQIEIIEDLESHNDYISFTWYLPGGDMNLFIGRNAYPIKMGKIEINLLVKVDTLIMALCNDQTTFSVGEDGIESVKFTTLGNEAHYHRFKGWFERAHSSNNEDYRLQHPFISNYYRAERIIDGNNYHNTCLGDLQGRIWSEFLNLDLIGMTLTLMQWNTTYNSVNTRPLNNIRQSFWGIPEGCDTEEFRGLYDMEPRDCNYRDIDNSAVDQDIDYCEWSGCVLRDRCDHYLEHMGEPLVEGTVSEVSTDNPIQGDREQDPMSVPIGNNIHGGEYTRDNTNDDEYELAEFARIAAENAGVEEEAEALNVTEEQVLEQLIRQQYQVIDIGRE